MRIIDLAKRLGYTSSYICHLIRINRLPPLIIDGYYSKLITISHLFIISRIKEEKKLLNVYEKILISDFNILQTEEFVRRILYGVKTKGSYLSEEEKDSFQHEFQKQNSMNLKIVQTRIKSRLTIEIKGGLDQTTEKLRMLIKKILT